MYVTQGTVQVEFTSKGIVVNINPIQAYCVKPGKEDCLVFLPDDAGKKTKFNALCFRSKQKFTANKTTFDAFLANAAIQGIKIEIKIKDRPKIGPDKTLKIEIESVKFPANI